MENKKLSTWGKISLVFVVLLTIAVIAINVALVIESGISHRMARNVISALISIVTAYYAIFEYKKPHGNALRYTMLIFAIFMVAIVLFETSKSHGVLRECGELCALIAAVLVAYMSGRLNKIEKNRWLTLVVYVLFVGKIVFYICAGDSPDFLHVARHCLPLAQWIVLASAYFTRFNMHREAGLADAPKAE